MKMPSDSIEHIHVSRTVQSDNSPLHIFEIIKCLVCLQHLRQRLIRFLLGKFAPDVHLRKNSIDTHHIKPIFSQLFYFLIEQLFERINTFDSIRLLLFIVVKIRDIRERDRLFVTYDFDTSVTGSAIDHTVKHDQLPIELIKRPDSDVAHFLQLGNRDTSRVISECQSLQQGHLVNDFIIYDVLHDATPLCRLLLISAAFSIVSCM